MHRRSVLKAGLALGLAGSLDLGRQEAAGAVGPLAALEKAHDARLGVYARNLRTGRAVTYRAGERFPMCSVFKTLSVAQILRDDNRCGDFLDEVIHYGAADIVDHSPITEKHRAMSVRDLCTASLQYSDNTAANLLLRATAGPAGVTAFCRSIGDRYTRLDRNEPDVNTAIPGDPRDTTIPSAIGRTFRRLLVGNALRGADRRLLVEWMTGNTTSGEQFRAGLPRNWRIADKTGSGYYGCANDVGIAWTTIGTPLVLAVMSVKKTMDAAADYPLIARTARLLADLLAPGE
jgi:beta-lactamase class A